MSSGAVLSRRGGFWTLAAILGSLLFASSAPSPLYVVYQAKWGFSAITLTSVFAVYALALLGALLVIGSLSDHLGRRPVLLVALVVQIAAMLAFAGAQGVGWLFVARILQGLATGTAMGAITAALLDLQPRSKPWMGALVGAAAPLSGLALGALCAGLLADYGPSPLRLVFWLLVAAFVVAALAVLILPETVTREPGWRRALRPQLAVPRRMRGAFVAALPSLAATWARRRPSSHSTPGTVKSAASAMITGTRWFLGIRQSRNDAPRSGASDCSTTRVKPTRTPRDSNVTRATRDLVHTPSALSQTVSPS